MNVIFADEVEFEYEAPVVVVGGGACGLSAALAASDAGAEVLLIERDKVPRGSTGLSTGLIPACGSRLQVAAGVKDSCEGFIADILRKTGDRTDHTMVERMVRASGPVIDWLCDAHGIELQLCEGLRYPGHSVDRMHGTANRSGAELQDQLLNAAERGNISVMTSAEVVDLHATRDRKVLGVRLKRPGGVCEDLGCRSLVLACCGFGANVEMIARYIPALVGAPYLGHHGNSGHAVAWGLALGAAIADMGSFQGHGAIGNPSGVPMWNTITINGIQVNFAGERFSNESAGYSEQALKVLAQSEGLVWNIFDQRGHELAMTYVDYREGLKIGGVRTAQSVEELSKITALPLATLVTTLADVAAMAAGRKQCPFGRDFSNTPPLVPPYFASRVTGAYLHTQGGLVVSPEDARVIDNAGERLPNLFAGGGAARGISGDSDSGYLAGNGLLTAVVLGHIAGKAAAELSVIRCPDMSGIR
jgi:fumarate reductase flavoprotein subunit